MKNQTLKEIIGQIKKYRLISEFNNEEEFKSWVAKLNNKQINNFLNLDIELEEIKDLNHLLINADLLNCDDYNKRVRAISTLKVIDGYLHLYDNLCKPNFLKSKNFYKDLEMLSKAENIRYALWAIAEDNFINSPYHDEDLKLIIESSNVKEDEPSSGLITEALATIAYNKDSIKSPYHRDDMHLISTSKAVCLQSPHLYPLHGLNNLAVNKVSLQDKYHLENMKILLTNPIASKFLYKLMTTPKFINGKFYREEVNALLNAKSKVTARALYYYIVNPKFKFSSDSEFYGECHYDILFDKSIKDKNSVAGSNDPNYLENLEFISKIDDEYVMYYVSLLMNQDFINSPYKEYDLSLLNQTKNKEIFYDLYILMMDEYSLNSPYHKKDVLVMSRAKSDKTRELLYQVSLDENSLQSKNHESDIEYVSKLDLDSISDEIYCEIYYYLCSKDGINDKDHVEKLEKLAQGIFVEKEGDVLRYLDSLEEQIEKSSDDEEIIKSDTPVIKNQKNRFSHLFKKRRKK